MTPFTRVDGRLIGAIPHAIGLDSHIVAGATNNEWSLVTVRMRFSAPERHRRDVIRNSMMFPRINTIF